MAFSFRAWLTWVLWKPFSRILEKIFLTLDPRSLEDVMRQQIEKMSDKDIDEAIKDIKEGDQSKQPYSSVMTIFQKAGIRREMLLDWFETEKSLREHRRKSQRSEAEARGK